MEFFLIHSRGADKWTIPFLNSMNPETEPDSLKCIHVKKKPIKAIG